MGNETKAQAIHGAISDDIVHGRLSPGHVLDETVIAARFGVSRTPIREAIRQLAASGLVTVRRNRKAVVATVTPSELDDMFAVMGELEAICARWAARAMTPQQRRDLTALHASGAKLVAANDRAGYTAFNSRFHETIYAGSRNQFLIEMTLSARRRCSPFRSLQFEARGRLADSFAEHARVIEAIERGDAEGAEEAMRAHILVVRDALDHLSTTPVQPKRKREKALLASS